MDSHFLSALFDPDDVVLMHAGAARADVVGLLAERLRPRAVPTVQLDLDATPAPASVRLASAASPRAGALAVLALPDERVEQALAAAGAMGARVALVFAERDGAAHRRRWAEAARAAGLRLVGPAALGVQRPHARLDASLLANSVEAGSIGLVCQSGAIASALLDWARDTQVGFSAVIALGDEVDVTVSDALDFLASDLRTHSIALYLEGVTQARRFMSALRGAAAGKPVVVLKGGADVAGRADSLARSPLEMFSRAGLGEPPAARHARTHAGALFGSRDVYAAALRRAGAAQIHYFLQLFATIRYLDSRHRPMGRRLAIVSNGGGPALLAADLSRNFGVRLPAFGRTGLNPLVLAPDVDAQTYADAVAAAAEDPEVDGVMAVFAPHPLVDAQALTQRVAEAARHLAKPLFACWLGDHTTRPLRRILSAVPVPTLRTPEAAAAAYATVASYFHNQQLSQQAPRSVTTPGLPDIEGARYLIDAALRDGRTTLNDAESKALLAAFRIPVTRMCVARDAAAAVEAAERIGYPVALKIVSPDVPHKNEVGGVALGVASAADVRARHAALLENVRRAAPGARIEGVGVEPMRGGRAVREVYVGAWRDAVFGPVLAFGAGGTQIEYAQDNTVEFPPLNAFLARRMMARTRISDALCALGEPDRVTEAVVTVLLRASEIVCELPGIAEMDINPLLVDAEGAVAVDARIVVREAPAIGSDPFAHLAIVPYPAELRRNVQLADGSVCTVRPIDPMDASDLQDFMRSLSPQTRYFRFVSMVAEHSPRQLARFTQIDYDREMALVAVVPPDPQDERGQVLMPNGVAPAEGEQIIGVVRYMLQPDLQTCEFAIVVGDDQQGKGLGRRLMASIIEVARAKGVARIQGFVLAANNRMLALMRAIGFRDRVDPDDPAMRIVWLELR